MNKYGYHVLKSIQNKNGPDLFYRLHINSSKFDIALDEVVDRKWAYVKYFITGKTTVYDRLKTLCLTEEGYRALESYIEHRDTKRLNRVSIFIVFIMGLLTVWSNLK